uniref:Fungal lipase-type domain-containing protein n=1 Tax=Kalanchoe fedtschenkoi TaxID=63787 RepID=A0A7N1A2E6_KALFE
MPSSSMIILPNTITNYATFQNDVIFKNPKTAVSQVSLQSERVSLPTSKHSFSVANTSVIRPIEKVVAHREESHGEDGDAATSSSLSQTWRLIQGCDDWEGLIEPLHPLLRQEMIRYGEFLVACYKAFDLDPKSSRYLNCKYGKKSMLKEVGMEKSGYEVTKYIYATPDMSGIPHVQGVSGSTCGRWIGYVSVSSDEESKRLGRRDVLVTFRGTVTNPEWIANLMSSLTPASFDPHNPRPEVMVESGFLSLYTSDECSSKQFGLHSCREQLLSEISRLVNKYKGEETSITVAGHSMGSSLGLLLAYDVAELGLNRAEAGQPIPITVLSFGGPRVGNAGFKARLEELGVKVLRIVNVNDPITKLPGIIFNENFRVFGSDMFEFSCYAHVGVELPLQFFNMANPCCVHDLGNYIQLLRCPKSVTDDVSRSRDGCGILEDVMSKAREVVSCASSFDMSPWMAAAANFVQLQSMIGL